MKLTDSNTLTTLQGDKVFVDGGSDSLLLTFVHVVDVNSRRLILVNKEEKSKTKEFEEFEVTQKMLDDMKPATKHKEAKWHLVI